MTESYRKPFVLIKRRLKRGTVYYYRLAGEKTAHSTGRTVKWKAEEWVRTEVLPRVHGDRRPMRELLEPYWDWDRCPHIRRLVSEGKRISPRYAADQRHRMTEHVLPDPLCELPVAEVRRADLLDFRSRLIAKDDVGGRTAQLTMQALRVALREAYYREDIDRDPGAGIGKLSYEKQEVGVFSAKEIKALFETCPGVWGDRPAYTAFLLAAHAGLRRGEIVGLCWEQIDYEAGVIRVDRAAFTADGLPKWGRKRVAPITPLCVAALRELRAESSYVLPHQYVFASPSGEHYSERWWATRFTEAMKAAGLEGRNLRPHSFRHSLNTLLRGAGADPARLRYALGWGDPATQDGYTHWQPEHFDEQREIAGKLLG